MNVKELVNLPASRLKRVVAIKAQIERLEARLGKILGSSGGPLGAIRTRRKMSAAARLKISLAAKARWARFRAAKGK